MRHLWTLEVPGTPVAKGRPRVAVVAGTARAYTPAKTRRYEQQLFALAAGRGIGLAPPTTTLYVTVKVFLPAPKSLQAAVRHAIEAGDETHPVLTQPDLDNYIKAALDALNGVAWRDQQISGLFATKHYSARPRLVVECYAIEGGAK